MLSGRFRKNQFLQVVQFLVLSDGIGYMIAAYATNYLIFTLGHGVFFIGIGVGIIYGIPVQIIQTVYEKNKNKG